MRTDDDIVCAVECGFCGGGIGGTADWYVIPE